MAGLILASVPVNAEAGSYLTFAGPVGLFCVVAAILYLQFSRPHRRVPPRRVLAPSRAGGSGEAGNLSVAAAAGPDERPAPSEGTAPTENTEASE